MGLPKDVSVIAWGISLERPTMIYYGIDNIRDLFGHKRNFMDSRNNEIAMYMTDSVQKASDDQPSGAQSQSAAPTIAPMQSNKKTDDLLNLLEISLKTNKYAAGDKLTCADRLAHENLAYAPNPDAHPHTFAWWAVTDRYTPAVKKTWPDAPAGCKICAKAQEKDAEKKPEPK